MDDCQRDRIVFELVAVLGGATLHDWLILRLVCRGAARAFLLVVRRFIEGLQAHLRSTLGPVYDDLVRLNATTRHPVVFFVSPMVQWHQTQDSAVIVHAVEFDHQLVSILQAAQLTMSRLQMDREAGAKMYRWMVGYEAVVDGLSPQLVEGRTVIIDVIVWAMDVKKWIRDTWATAVGPAMTPGRRALPSSGPMWYFTGHQVGVSL